jgi:hypothetical protein
LSQYFWPFFTVFLYLPLSLAFKSLASGLEDTYLDTFYSGFYCLLFYLSKLNYFYPSSTQPFALFNGHLSWYCRTFILVLDTLIGDIIFTKDVTDRYFAISFQGPEGNEAAIIAKRWQKTSPQETVSLNEHYNTGVIIPAHSNMDWSVLGTETGYVEVSILGVLTNKPG